jgi:hypothetical protein
VIDKHQEKEMNLTVEVGKKIFLFARSIAEWGLAASVFAYFVPGPVSSEFQSSIPMRSWHYLITALLQVLIFCRPAL